MTETLRQAEVSVVRDGGNTAIVILDGDREKMYLLSPGAADLMARDLRQAAAEARGYRAGWTDSTAKPRSSDDGEDERI